MLKRVLLSATVSLLFAASAVYAAPRPRVRPARTVVKTQMIPAAKAPAAAQKVAKDADGKLRAPTADESDAIAPASVAPGALKQTTFSDGSIMIELDESYMIDMVATKNADGTVSTHCKPAAPKEVK